MTTTTTQNGQHMRDEDVMEVPAAMSGLVQSQGGATGEVDVQITTAKRFPRSIKGFKDMAMAMATLDEETAESCFYALPRGGKTVEGPSARLAEIVASAWGNMRIEGRPIAEDERFVTSRGTAWDLQTNVAFAFESRRRITDKKNVRYNDDMIGVTANAATSIALRNAVFKAVPSAFWRPIYLKCREVAVGTQQTLADRRAKALEHFQKMGVSNDRVFALFNVKGVEDINLDHLAALKGLATAIKDNETSIDEAFPEPGQRAAAAGAPKPAKPVPTAPAGFDDWRTDLEAMVENGPDVLAEGWEKSDPKFRLHLAAIDPTAFQGLMSKAENFRPTAVDDAPDPDETDQEAGEQEIERDAAPAESTSEKPTAKADAAPAKAPIDPDDPFDLKKPEPKKKGGR